MNSSNMNSRDMDSCQMAAAVLRSVRDRLVEGRNLSPAEAAALEAGARALDAMPFPSDLFSKEQSVSKAREASDRFRESLRQASR